MRALLLLPALLLGLAAGSAVAITPADLGTTGTFLRSGGPSPFTIGAGGAVEELEGFLFLPGEDLNGAGPGVAAQLSSDPLPAGLALAFSSSLSDGGSDLLLRYDFTNTGTATLSGIGFVSFLDAEIDEPTNTFFNEYAEVEGAPAAGQGFEADEPGFVSGDIFANALAGVLDDSNAVPFASPDDVSLALSFLLGALAPGEIARFDVLISEDGDALGGVRLRQLDVDAASTTVITFSGAAAIVPEPGTGLLLAAGLAGLGRLRRR